LKDQAMVQGRGERHGVSPPVFSTGGLTPRRSPLMAIGTPRFRAFWVFARDRERQV
jgi:hypothetical protein